ncbi:hypothetical protein [Bacteroides sp. 51]|nr:hypothetical protein [Bacteroides sp. 51]
MEIQIPRSDKKRVVIIGGGFGGLALANKLDNDGGDSARASFG